MATAVYVYGVVAATDAPQVGVGGVAGCAVRAIGHDELCALVSDLDSTTLTAARAVRAHWRVLEAAGERATVVPARFGTVMESDDAVRDGLLAANADGLSATLRELAGRVQVRVRAAYDEPRLLHDIVAASPAIAALRRRVQARPEAAGYYDRIRLGEAVSAAVDRRREADARRALGRLAPLAVATREEALGGTDAAFDLSFLVERGTLDAFGAQVGALREELGDGVSVRYVGPLPPFSFADAELSATGAT
jgi:hypothetical protein